MIYSRKDPVYMTKNIRSNRQPATPNRRLAVTALVLSCVVMVTGGFFVAARQHFSSMDYGMKNSRLRKQVDQLEAEKRRLMLAREISLSPTEIKKAVKKVGLGEAAREPMSVALASTSSTRSMASTAATTKPLVEKTVSVRTTRPTVASLRGGEKSDKLTKKGAAADAE
jgi:hypothetical protein